jgi:hypothetical protein
MDIQSQILLNSQKNVNSVNADMYEKLTLSNKIKEINEFDVKGVVNASEQFDIEREANAIYRIYGRIEYMSLLNGLKTNYTQFQDFFTPIKFGNLKNIINSFNFYLVTPTTGYTQILNTNNYIRYFKVIATSNQFDIYPAGFSNNVYNEQTYAFNFNVDIDISNYYDNFNFPVTELYLYAQYKVNSNGNGQSEYLNIITWDASGNASNIPITTTSFNIGDVISSAENIKISDIVTYDMPNFLQTQYSGQTFYITTQFISGITTQRFIWKYNPLISIRLRYLTDSLYTANSGNTSYEITSSIPDYATLISGGNYVWRNIMPEGYIDPLTGIGTNYPFVNERRYLFTPIILDIIPDLDDPYTLAMFNDIFITKNETNSTIKPTSDINNINKPCQ